VSRCNNPATITGEQRVMVQTTFSKVG